VAGKYRDRGTNLARRTLQCHAPNERRWPAASSPSSSFSSAASSGATQPTELYNDRNDQVLAIYILLGQVRGGVIITRSALFGAQRESAVAY